MMQDALLTNNNNNEKSKTKTNKKKKSKNARYVRQFHACGYVS